MVSGFRDGLAVGKGIGLSAYRYVAARREVLRVRDVESQLSSEHLANLKVVPDRLALLDHMPKGGVAVEVGVAAGGFSREIFDRTVPSHLYLIDFWKTNKRAHGISVAPGKQRKSAPPDWVAVNERMETEISQGIVSLMRGFSWDEIPKLPDHGIDWAYVDASHDYRSVKKDLDALLPKMKEDGIIAGHDYVKWGRYGFRCGVVEAVNEFCLRSDFEMIFLSMDARTTSSFAIRKR